MKVGSLVELVKDDWDIYHHNPVCDNKTSFPVKGKPYTVRDIFTKGGYSAIVLEEISNPVCKGSGLEEAFMIHRFRELQPPIANIEEHINQNTLELVS